MPTDPRILVRSYGKGAHYDEMLDADGAIRPHYRSLADQLSAMDEADRETRMRTAAQYLREAGVFYRAPEAGGVERAWPLAFPPLVIDPKEWRHLEGGLKQRATYLERLLADLYGERRLVREGVLPGRFLGHNPEFLRPLADQGLSGRPLLHFIAVDLGRGPDGVWRVLGDRTQAPSGAGFALENRVATGKAFPDLAKAIGLQRLAGFFGRFREQLNALNGAVGGKVGLWTPGPHNETYFEHAYLARYLGFHLLEGGDIVVRGEKALIRTVDGLRPLHVLWRRLDADFADPLELYSGSQIGTPGIVRAVRAGELHLVNALGSGILETAAFAAFETGMARALLGESLELASAEAVLVENEAPADWTVAPAFPSQAGSHLSAGNSLARAPLALSTVPVFSEGKLEARPLTLRVFLARTREGWEVMPGGFARVARTVGTDAHTIASGGQSLDVWVPGEVEERPVTLLGAPSGGFQRRLPGALPARAADNLFWLGRYVERTEAACRLWRASLDRAASETAPTPADKARLGMLARSGVGLDGADPAAGLLLLARSAFEIASRIRDRFSPDGWRVLGELVDLLREAVKADQNRDDAALASRILTGLSGFSGLVGENMYQFAGWRFLECGRRLERGLVTAEIGAAFLRAGGEGVFEALLDFTDSRMTYRRRFSVELTAPTVLDLCVLDPLNPRSVAYQIAALRRVVAELPGNRRGESLDRSSRRIARLAVRLETAEPGEVDAAFLMRIGGDLFDISNLLSERFFTVGTLGKADQRSAE